MALKKKELRSSAAERELHRSKDFQTLGVQRVEAHGLKMQRVENDVIFAYFRNMISEMITVQ